MTDRLTQEKQSKAIRLVESLDNKLVDSISQNNLGLDSLPLILGPMESMGLNPQSPNDMFLVKKAAIDRKKSYLSVRPTATLAGDYIRLENIVCADSDGRVFESHPELYISRNIFRDDKGEILFLKPYDSIRHCEQVGSFLPSLALQCNSLAAIFCAAVEQKNNWLGVSKYKTKDADFESVLKQYKDKGNGNGYQAQNTVVNWGAKQIIHYPLDSDFPSDGGTSGINKQKRVELGFDDKGFENADLKEALKIPNYAKFIKNLTGLQDPSVLIEIGKYFGRTARVWVSSSNETRACWLGCVIDYFSLDSGYGLSDNVASRGVRKKIP